MSSFLRVDLVPVSSQQWNPNALCSLDKHYSSGQYPCSWQDNISLTTWGPNQTEGSDSVPSPSWHLMILFFILGPKSHQRLSRDSKHGSFNFKLTSVCLFFFFCLQVFCFLFQNTNFSFSTTVQNTFSKGALRAREMAHSVVTVTQHEHLTWNPSTHVFKGLGAVVCNSCTGGRNRQVPWAY